MKIINFDEDLALKQKEEAERDAKTRFEMLKSQAKKEKTGCIIALPFLIALIVGGEMFIHRHFDNINIFLNAVLAVGAFCVVIFPITIIWEANDTLKETEYKIWYTPLTKYWMLTYNKLYKKQIICFADHNTIKITTVNPDDTVSREYIYLPSSFKKIEKAYIEEPEIDLVNKVIYMPVEIDE
jgi:hypothetical protein